MGPIGKQGIEGKVGPTGFQGPTATGNAATGSQGTKGKVGKVGLQGKTGNEGPRGIAGGKGPLTVYDPWTDPNVISQLKKMDSKLSTQVKGLKTDIKPANIDVNLPYGKNKLTKTCFVENASDFIMGRGGKFL